MIFLRIFTALALAFIASAAFAQQPEIHFGAPGEGMPPAPETENYLAKCIANPEDRIACHLARTQESDGGLENFVKGDVAASVYVTCNKSGGVCLELATFDPDEGETAEPQPEPKSRLPSVDISILFDYDQATIRNSETDKLKQLAAALRSNGDSEDSFAVIGHTDARGTDTYNCALSHSRADVVVQRLSTLGVPAKRLRSVGVGEKLLRDTHNGEAAINRRVGFARITDDSKAVTSKLFALCKS